MQIILYNNSAEKNRVDKTSYLSNALTLNGNLRNNDSGNVLSPTIYLEMNNNSIPTYNYAYIPSFNRYYFITNIEPARNDYWEINMKEDVLMSFKSEIKNQTALVSRNENEYNEYLEDSLVIFDKLLTIETTKSSKSPLFESTGVSLNNPFMYVCTWIGGSE